MTYGEIFEEFCETTNLQHMVVDYRPCDSMFDAPFMPNSILVWLKNGSRLIYTAKTEFSCDEETSKLVTKKYTIDYWCGTAYLYTPYPPEERFYTLANTCFGIRKNIMCCVISKTEETDCQDFERLEFNGDVYVWDSEGRRKMIEPKWTADEDWDDYYCEECKYKG